MIYNNTYEQRRFIFCEGHDEIIEEWKEVKHIENRFPLYHRWQVVRYV